MTDAQQHCIFFRTVYDQVRTKNRNPRLILREFQDALSRIFSSKEGIHDAQQLAIARQLYRHPYLLYHGVDSYEQRRHERDLHALIREVMIDHDHEDDPQEEEDELLENDAEPAVIVPEPDKPEEPLFLKPVEQVATGSKLYDNIPEEDKAQPVPPTVPVPAVSAPVPVPAVPVPAVPVPVPVVATVPIDDDDNVTAVEDACYDSESVGHDVLMIDDADHADDDDDDGPWLPLDGDDDGVGDDDVDGIENDVKTVVIKSDRRAAIMDETDLVSLCKS
jgi:hypothetical protein